MCPLHPEPPSHLSPHPIPPCCPRAPALGALHHTSDLRWSSVLHMVIYVFQCYSLKSSHPLLLPLRSAFENVFGNAFLSYLFLAALGLCCCEGLSRVVENRGYSSCSVQAPHCGGVSCCRAWALAYMGFSVCDPQALEHRLSTCGAWT